MGVQSQLFHDPFLLILRKEKGLTKELAVSESGRRGWGYVVGTKRGGEYWGFGEGGPYDCAEGYGGPLSGCYSSMALLEVEHMRGL